MPDEFKDEARANLSEVASTFNGSINSDSDIRETAVSFALMLRQDPDTLLEDAKSIYDFLTAGEQS